MRDISRLVSRALTTKPSRRCPIQREAPRGARLREVPPRLRELLCLECDLRRKLDWRRKDAERVLERVHAVEILLRDSIHDLIRRGRRVVHIEFYSDWQYTATPI